MTVQIRILLGASLLMLILTLLASRLIWLQVYQHEKYKEVVRKEHRRNLVLPARRGSVYDRNGELLAADRSVRDVVADRKHLNRVEFGASALAHSEGVKVKDIYETYSDLAIRNRYLELVAHRLSRPLGKRPWEVLEKISNKKRNDIFLAPKYNESQAIELEKDLAEQKIRGIYCRRSMDRFYAYDSRITQLAGFVNHKNNGVSGIEKSYNQELSGVDGFREIESIRGGIEMPAFRGKSQAPKHGSSVYLTIDMRIQEILEKYIEEAFIEYKAEKVMAVVTRPKTGEILAMGSRPHFNRSDGKKGVRKNHCITDTYEPGSTFKLITFGGVYQHNLVNPNTPIFCHNGYLKGHGLVSPLRDHHPYGSLSVSGVLAKSSNIGTYLLARQLGKKRLCDFVQTFGFGQKTGIKLNGEGKGIFRDYQKWSGTSLSRIAIGYEVSVTPLQMVMAIGAIANGGELLEPQIAYQLQDQHDQIISSYEPKVRKRVMTTKSAKWLAGSMKKVLEDGGTGTKGRIDGVEVAGKTGTARKYFSKLPATGRGGYGKGRYVASFGGFFPVKDPEIAMIIVVDDPQNEVNQRYGGTVAAPLFSKIGTDIVDVLGINRVTTASVQGGAN